MNYFYWQKTITGLWTPVLSEDRPTVKGAGGLRPKFAGVVELNDSEKAMRLSDLALRYPDPDTPTADAVVDAPDGPKPTPLNTEVSVVEPPKMTEEELLVKLEAIPHWLWQNSLILHVKSGHLYWVTGAHFREHDMVLCIEYAMHDNTRIKFSRPLTEMIDGRFFSVSEEPVLT